MKPGTEQKLFILISCILSYFITYFYDIHSYKYNIGF